MPARHRALSVETADWSLVLKTAADPAAQRERLAAILGRSAEDPTLAGGLEVDAPGWKAPSGILPPSVFENTSYSISIRPNAGFRVVFVRHPVRADIEGLFDEDDDGDWHGSLRTGNDLGWFPLEIGAAKIGDERTRVDRIAWLVWPLKLDLGHDLRRLTAAIEKEYPLWLFRFMAPTRHDAGKSAGRAERFLLVWASQFQSLWTEFERGLRIVIESPHVRLAGSPARLRTEAIRSRLGRKGEESIAERRDRPDFRHAVSVWRSSADTAENRFILYVLDSCLSGLERLRRLADQPGLSDSFRLLVAGWLRALRGYRGDPLFRGLGPFTGLARESLVLQNRAGYAAVYRSWLELRRHLEFFARLPSSRVGMKSIDEVYEIWCFLEIRNILENLGFAPVKRPAPRWKDRGLERSFDGDSEMAFQFAGENGLNLRLAHEPIYSRLGAATLKSFTVSQRPDIVLEASWPGYEESPESRLVWIFDAKYRLKSRDAEWDRDEHQGRSDEFLAPPDAIDQMHRYRDSILLALEGRKSRPTVSAFALYPAPLDQQSPPESNPYAEAIAEVGIGAFPLLPGENGGLWLTAHLRNALDVHGPGDVTRRPSVMIPATGLEYEEEDTLVILLRSGRHPDYLRRFREGYATGYHCYVAGGPAENRLSRVNYLAFAVGDGHAGRPMLIRGVYLLLERTIRTRSGIKETESGVSIPERPDDSCHWFKLGRYIQMSHPLEAPGEGGGWYRYTSLSRLFAADRALGPLDAGPFQHEHGHLQP